MIIDVNLLLYARNRSDPRSDQAASWLERTLNGPVRVGLPWQSLTAFLRVASHPRVFPRPLDVSDAWVQVEEWLAAPAAWIPVPGRHHDRILGSLLVVHRVNGALVSDAHLAALALEHGVGLYSTDADFARFSDLRWIDPLQS